MHLLYEEDEISDGHEQVHGATVTRTEGTGREKRARRKNCNEEAIRGDYSSTQQPITRVLGWVPKGKRIRK